VSKPGAREKEETNKRKGSKFWGKGQLLVLFGICPISPRNTLSFGLKKMVSPAGIELE
jgi:hypothetical protein